MHMVPSANQFDWFANAVLSTPWGTLAFDSDSEKCKEKKDETFLRSTTWQWLHIYGGKI